jgi:glycerate kinase
VPVIAASDVRNPLVGPSGASAVYGPQKGASPADVAELDAALTHYARIVRRDVGVDVADLPGAGAAGGLGAALAAFLDAAFRPGIDVVMDAAEFETRAAGADWVFTGEGRLDSQTLSGKLIAGLLARCRPLGIPVGAFGGKVDADAVRELGGQGLRFAAAMVSGAVTVEEAMRESARVLTETVARTLEDLSTESGS